MNDDFINNKIEHVELSQLNAYFFSTLGFWNLYQQTIWI
jgi:hypothetical protein